MLDKKVSYDLSKNNYAVNWDTLVVNDFDVVKVDAFSVFERKGVKYIRFEELNMSKPSDVDNIDADWFKENYSAGRGWVKYLWDGEHLTCSQKRTPLSEMNKIAAFLEELRVVSPHVADLGYDGWFSLRQTEA